MTDLLRTSGVNGIPAQLPGAEGGEVTSAQDPPAPTRQFLTDHTESETA